MSKSQQSAWDREYQDPQFISLSHEPSQDVMRFLKWIKKEGSAEYQIPDINKEDTFVLDLGCGNGRHLNFLADQYGVSGMGIDFSPTAITAAREHAESLGVTDRINYLASSIAEPESFGDIPDQSVDMALDITASNALYEGERELFLREVSRVLKPEGIFFTRALSLDGDRNARNLLEYSPGPEYHTYIHPKTLIAERVFTESEFRDLYEKYFEILYLKKQTGYQRWGSQSFKRRYIVAYMRKK